MGFEKNKVKEKIFRGVTKSAKNKKKHRRNLKVPQGFDLCTLMVSRNYSQQSAKVN